MASVIIETTDPRHRKIVTFLRARIDYAKRRLDGRKDNWREAEKQYRAFLDLEAVDVARRRREPEGTYPGFAPLIIPSSYAVVNTILTFLMAVFGTRRPTIQVDGIGPEDVKPAEALETVIHYQMQKVRLQLQLYLWFHDCLVYGVGWLKNTWKRKFNYQTVLETAPGMLMLSRAFGFEAPKRRTTRWIKTYEGNYPTVVDPYKFWHDPRVPVTRVHEGEFQVIAARKSFTLLKKDEQEGLYYNIDSLKDKRPPGTTDDMSRGESDIPRQVGLSELDEAQFVDKVDPGHPLLEEVQVRIIPSDLELGGENFPQNWIFTLANKDTLIRSETVEHLHEEFFVDGIEYLPDVHVPTNPGVVSLIRPLSEHLSWLFNSHMENVRKVVNDMLVWDPSRIRQEDVEARGPGKSIRLKSTAYGQDVRTAMHQLQVVDVTQGHLRDTQVVWELIQRASGATDNFMGLPSIGGARTATEVRGIQQLSSGRLKNLAELFSVMGFIPFSQKCVMNTQQFMEDQMILRLVGRAIRDPNVIQHIKVSPEEIVGNFDFPVLDGTFPMDRFAMADAWREIFQAIVQVEPLLQVFDVVEVFRQGAQSLGVKNIEDFLLKPDSQQAAAIKTTVQDDETVQKRTQRGDIVPLSGDGAPREAEALAQILGVPGGGRRGDAIE